MYHVMHVKELVERIHTQRGISQNAVGSKLCGQCWDWCHWQVKRHYSSDVGSGGVIWSLAMKGGNSHMKALPPC